MTLREPISTPFSSCFVEPEIAPRRDYDQLLFRPLISGLVLLPLNPAQLGCNGHSSSLAPGISLGNSVYRLIALVLLHLQYVVFPSVRRTAKLDLRADVRLSKMPVDRS